MRNGIPSPSRNFSTDAHEIRQVQKSAHSRSLPRSKKSGAEANALRQFRKQAVRTAFAIEPPVRGPNRPNGPYLRSRGDSESTASGAPARFLSRVSMLHPKPLDHWTGLTPCILERNTPYLGPVTSQFRKLRNPRWKCQCVVGVAKDRLGLKNGSESSFLPHFARIALTSCRKSSCRCGALCAPSDARFVMVHFNRRRPDDTPSLLPYAEAQVDIIEGDRKLLAEPADTVEHLPPHDHAGRRDTRKILFKNSRP